MKTYEDLIKIYESYDALYKQAAATGTAAAITGALKATDAVTDKTKSLAGLAFKTTILPSLIGIPVTAGAAGIITSAITSPHALSETADKRIIKAALDSEIAVMERKIAEEILARQQAKEKKYDRFV